MTEVSGDPCWQRITAQKIALRRGLQLTVKVPGVELLVTKLVSPLYFVRYCSYAGRAERRVEDGARCNRA
jgi:hypothetical protein